MKNWKFYKTKIKTAEQQDECGIVKIAAMGCFDKLFNSQY